MISQFNSLGRDAFRGLGFLPNSGLHPGLLMLAFLCGSAGYLGWANGGTASAIQAIGIVLILFLPVLLISAAIRARISDHVSRRVER